MSTNVIVKSGYEVVAMKLVTVDRIKLALTDAFAPCHSYFITLEEAGEHELALKRFLLLCGSGGAKARYGNRKRVVLRMGIRQQRYRLKSSAFLKPYQLHSITPVPMEIKNVP